MPRLDFPRLTKADAIAGTSVALVLIPQSLAYAEIARRFTMEHMSHEGGHVTVRPVGMMWMANDAKFAQGLRDAAEASSGDVTVDFRDTPFLDDAAIDAMSSVSDTLSSRGHRLGWSDPPADTERMLNGVQQSPDAEQTSDAAHDPGAAET